MRGIILIANGHPMYGFYANSLAIGIKCHAPDLPIALITDGSAIAGLDESERKRFDYIIETKKDWITGHEGKTDLLKCKLYIGEVTPFDETLYLDVDMQLCNRKNINQAFNELKGLPFTIANRGVATGNRRTEWMDLKEGEKYGVTELHDISSEWIYFEESGKKVFAKAIEVYNENKLIVDDFDLNKPDEPYLSIAMGICKIKPHIVPYVPTYWQPYYGNKFHSVDFIYNNHYAMSAGGRSNPKPIRDKIDALTGSYYHRLGINKEHYRTQDKSSALRREKRRQNK